MALAVWQSTIVNRSGDVQPNAQVEVRLESSGALAAIYSDRSGSTPLDNPFSADSNGFARFYAAGGAYKITASLGDFSHTYRHQSIGLLAEQDVATDDRFYYRQTAAEIAAGVTPSDYSKEPGHILRYWSGISSDYTAAVQAAIDQCSAGGADVFIPPGEWTCSDSIAVKSNIRIYGVGDASAVIADNWVGSVYSLLYRDRSLGELENVVIENIRVHGAISGVTPGHSNQGSAVLLEWCRGIRLRNVNVTQSEDACIRISGYKDDTEFPLTSNDPDANPGLGHATDCEVIGCRTSGGYIGLEIEGGASVKVLGGYFDGGENYGIRMPRAQNCSVIGATIYSANDQALWMDYVNRSKVIGNTIISADDVPEPAVAIGFLKDTIIADNTIRGGSESISDAVFHSSIIDSGGYAKISNNNCDARIRIWYHQQALVYNNECTLVQFQDVSKGVCKGNIADLDIGAGKSVADGGSDVIVLDNIDDDTMRPYAGGGNWGVIGAGTAPPASGTYVKGNILWNSDPDVGEELGWVCVAGGTPGTWVRFGQVRYRVFSGAPTVDSNHVGEEVLDTTNGVWYKAKTRGSGANDWVALNS